MAQILQTIDEYIVKNRKKDTIWIVFNTVYNDVHTLKKELDAKDFLKYLNKKFTDTKAQKEFLDFMASELPDVKITQVFDLVSPNYLHYPYLGSYAIDVDKDSKEYKKIIEKYEDSFGEPLNNNAVLWISSYEKAEKIYKKRKKLWEAELD